LACRTWNPHRAAVNVGWLQVDALTQAQASRIERHQNGSLFEILRRGDELGDLALGQDDRELSLPLLVVDLANVPGSP
jgi:hypothetical protein